MAAAGAKANQTGEPTVSISIAPTSPGAEGGQIALAVRPAAVAVSPDEPTDPALSRVRAELIDLEPRGDFVRARGALLSADVSPKEAARLDAAVGSPVWFAFAPAATTVYPTALPPLA